MTKTLVTYFSAGGNTKRLAVKIANALNADLFEIKPKIPYTIDDLDWTDQNSRSSIEMKDYSTRPEIESKCENIENYDTIILGFPIWWYIAPTLINTFLEKHNLENKIIIPFATSGGSGVGQTDKWLQSSAPKAKWKPAKLLNNSISTEELKKYFTSMQNE